jgi:hypothetical protein
MKARFGILAACALSACMAGCATPRTSTAPAAVVTSQGARVIPPERAADAIAVGRSTRSDVLAALGETLAIRFESGFEIWVYRLADDAPGNGAPVQRAQRGAEKRAVSRPSAEFVVLFAPSGLVAKTRIRAGAAG